MSKYSFTFSLTVLMLLWHVVDLVDCQKLYQKIVEKLNETCREDFINLLRNDSKVLKSKLLTSSL
jgi:uncharacterized membrane protein YjdF